MQTTDIETIKHALAVNRGHFPEQAVRAAIEQREAVTPILLAALEAAADDPEALQIGETKMLHIYAMYLLAQFREKAAYPLLVRFFSVPGELTLDLTGDVVTEDLRRILASVCDDDLEPIQRMIEDPVINEYVRSACLKALVILVGEGRVPREQVIGYFASLFREKLARDDDYVWTALVTASRDLHPRELIGDIEQAYADGLIETFFVRLEDVRRILSEDRDQVMREARERSRGLIDDTVVEMRGWACFRRPEPAPKPSDVIAATRPAVRGQKIGRNDPCPCGSGKKYKKCCIH
jgi:hypothetical protein